MSQTTEWITPLEASLEVSVRKGFFVSPDDLKQLRNTGKIDKQYVKHASKRLTLYDRSFIVAELPAPTKRHEPAIEAKHVADWLEDCTETIGSLLKQGFRIPDLEAAQCIVREREEEREQRKNKGLNRGRYSPKKESA